MSLRQKAFRGAVWALVQSSGVRVLSFVVFAVLARVVAPESFGLVALALLLIAFFEATLVQSFGDALVRRPAVDPEHLDACFWASVALGALVSLFVIALVPAAATVFREPGIAPVARWLALSVPITALGRTQEALLKRELKFKQLALRSLVSVGLSSVIAVGLAFAGFGIWALVVKTIAEAAFGSVMLWLSCDWRPRLRWPRPAMRDLADFGVRLAGTRVLEFLSQRFDALVIGSSLGAAMLAQYTVGQRISQIVMETLHQSISNVSLPTFATIQEDASRLKLAYVRTMRFTAFVAMPVFALVAIRAKEIIGLVFGPQWTWAVPVLAISACGGMVFSFSFYVAPLLLAKGRAGAYSALVLLNVVLGASFIVAAKWGVAWVAAAVVLRGVITSVIAFVLIHRLIGVGMRDVLHAVRQPFLLTLAMSVAVMGATWGTGMDGTVLCLVTSAVLGALVYLIAARWLAADLLAEVLSTLTQLVPQLNRFAALLMPVRR